MTQEKRRSRRYNLFLPITVAASDNTTPFSKAGPFQGRIINISRHGACLLMSQVMANTYHLYHSTKEDESAYLRLTINIQPEIIDCKILGQPVWMDIFHEGDIRAFKIGVEFTVDAESDGMMQLEQVINKR